MNQTKLSKWLPGAIAALLGLIFTLFTRGSALAEDATSGAKLLFAMSLILTLCGLVAVVAGIVPSKRKTDTKTLAYSAMFATLCYIGFTFFKIDIPVGTEKTAFHLGNVFCVLGALLLGGLWGGLSGAVGMTIADLTTSYVTSAPKTFFLKLCIGLVTGLVAHGIFKLSRDKERKVSLPVATVISCAAGMAFNVVADPIVGYFYKTYIFGIPQDMAKALAKIGAVTTLVNAIVAVVAATVLYLALRPALKKAKLIGDI